MRHLQWQIAAGRTEAAVDPLGNRTTTPCRHTFSELQAAHRQVSALRSIVNITPPGKYFVLT